MLPLPLPRAPYLATTHTYGARAARLSLPDSPRGPVGPTILVMFWVWFRDMLRSYLINDESGIEHPLTIQLILLMGFFDYSWKKKGPGWVHSELKGCIKDHIGKQ